MRFISPFLRGGIVSVGIIGATAGTESAVIPGVCPTTASAPKISDIKAIAVCLVMNFI